MSEIPSPRLRSEGSNSPGAESENLEGRRVETAAAEAGIPFGRAVVTGATEGQVRLPSASTDKFRGVAMQSTDARALNDGAYIAGDPVGVGNPIAVDVELEEDVEAGDDVRVRHTEDKTAGEQKWGFSSAKTSASASGLANDATAYTASIVIDGVAKAISIVGSASQTLATVVSQIQTDVGAAGIVSFDTTGNGFIKVVSATKGASSSVKINDVDLFAGLTGHNAAAETAVAGTDTGTAALAPGRFCTTAVPDRTFKLNGARYLTGGSAGGTARVLLNGAITTTADT